MNILMSDFNYSNNLMTKSRHWSFFNGVFVFNFILMYMQLNAFWD